uniref:Uncharacterized protein n=1 Tax=Leersia perrieri TaxID=77586 RepID=A0A0D9W714_9ORYZ
MEMEKPTTTVEALGLLEPDVWTPLYPEFLYDLASFRSQTEGFVFDPLLFHFGTIEDGYFYDEHGFLVEATEEDVADDISRLCARVKELKEEADALASSCGGGSNDDDVEVDGEDADAGDEGAFDFSHINDLIEELLEDDETTTTTKGF